MKPGHNTNLGLTGGEQGRGSLAPARRELLPSRCLLHDHHISNRNALSNADNQFNFGVNRFQNGIGCKGWGYINNTAIGIGSRFCAVLPCQTLGLPSTHSPPLPGVTPPTTSVPYSIICWAWNIPCLPVIPCTMRRVSIINENRH